MRLWPQRRAWRITLILFLATVTLAGALGLWAGWQLRDPQRLLRLGLDALESRSGLRFEAAGTPTYTLRPGITLRVPGLQVRDPQDEALIATVEALDLALPWDTARGQRLLLDRLDARSVRLDVAALQRWLDRQPVATTRPPLPELPGGLALDELTLTGDRWSLVSRPATLGAFRTDAPVALALAGDLRAGDRHGPFALTTTLRLQPDGSGYTLHLADLDLQGNPWLPGFRGNVTLPAAGDVRLTLDGTVPAWPADWPALPPPLEARDQPLTIRLLIARARDATHLRLAREGLAVDATLEPQAVQAWWNGGQPQTWLPPAATGHVEAEKLVVEGVTLEGVGFTLGNAEAEAADGH